MKTPLEGVFVIEPQRHEDERGFFARTFCTSEFARHGLSPLVRQCNVSYNRRRGTLRGLHYQAPPLAETKLVRCTAGAIHDVVVDLREDSPTFASHFAIQLTAETRCALFIPEGLAHGFQTLCDDVEVFYQMSQVYSPEHARGIRFDDPRLGLEWPEPVTVISDRDRSYPDWV